MFHSFLLFVFFISLMIDIANLDFRPNPDSVLVDAGTVINGITDSYSGNAPDIGAYEYGGDMWSAGIDWNLNAKFGNSWIDYINSPPQIDSIIVANNNSSIQVFFNENVFS